MPTSRRKLDKHEPSDFRIRFRVIGVVVLAAFFILLARLWYLQILNGSDLRQRSENNRIRVREIKPLRGLIIDAYQNILVDNHPSFDISIIPEEAKDIRAVVETLTGLYEAKALSFSGNLSSLRVQKPFVPLRLETNVSWDKVAVVETNLGVLPGIMVDVVPVREYVMGAMMAHVLGYVGEIAASELSMPSYKDYRADDIVGKYGVEKRLDKYLKGARGGEQIEVNVTGRKLKVLSEVASMTGANVIVTLDSKLQKACWDAFNKKAGSVIVMNPKDGSILAMVSKPSFDPNLFNRGIATGEWGNLLNNPLSPLQNRSIGGQYPPGSTFKPIVAAAALEEGLVHKGTSVYCNGQYQLGNHTYRCWKKHGHGEVDLYKAIVQSCDVFFYSLGAKIGVDTLSDYARKFGFGERTGIELTGERPGLVPSTQWKRARFNEPWQKGETIVLSIGQGFILVTPLQLIRAYCAIANGGTLYRPRIIERVESSGGDRVNEYPPVVEGRLPLSADTIKLMKKALWGAVNEPRGTGRALMRDERDVCGKTGTAQVIGLPEEGDDADEEKVPYKLRDHALFVCFAPKEQPEIAIMVIVEHGGHGGSAAAPIARKVLDRYFELKKERS